MLPRFLTKLMEMNPFYDPILGWGSSTNRSLPSGSTNSLFQRMSASTTIHHGSHHHRPTKILNEKIRDRDWDACRLRVLYYASDALFISKKMNNATPLHLACLYR